MSEEIDTKKRSKKPKQVTVVGIFKSLSASHYTFTGHGEGSNLDTATTSGVRAMFKALRRQKNVKGKRSIRNFTLDVTIDEPEEDTE